MHKRFGDLAPVEWGGELEMIIEVGEEEPDWFEEGSADIDGSTHSNGRFSVTQAMKVINNIKE